MFRQSWPFPEAKRYLEIYGYTQVARKKDMSERSPGRPLSYNDRQVARAKELRQDGCSYRVIAEKLRVSLGTAWAMVNRG